MPEEHKVGGIIFDLSVDEAGIIRDFENIVSRIKASADDAENAFNKEMKNIAEAVRKAQQQINRGTTDSNKQFLNSYIETMGGVRNEVAKTYTQMKANLFSDSDFSGVMNQSKTRLSNALIDINKRSARLKAQQEDFGSYDTNYGLGNLVDSSALTAQLEQVKSKLSEFNKGNLSDQDEVSKTMLENQHKQIEMQQHLNDAENRYVNESKTRRQSLMEIEKQQIAVDTQLEKVNTQLHLNPTDKKASKEKDQLLVNKDMLEQNKAYLTQQQKDEDELYRIHKDNSNRTLSVLKAYAQDLKAVLKDIVDSETRATHELNNALKNDQAASELRIAMENAHSQLDSDMLARDQSAFAQKAMQQAVISNANNSRIDEKYVTPETKDYLQGQAESDYKHHMQNLQNTQREEKNLANQRKRDHQEFMMNAFYASFAVSSIVGLFGGKGLYDLLLGEPAQIQRSMTQFGLLINDLQEAQRAMGQFKELAKNTSLNIGDITGAASMLGTTDMSAASIEDLARRIADLAGGRSEIYKQLALVTQQISSAGILQGNDILQIRNTGIPIQQEIAKNLDVSMDKMKTMQSQGLITSQMYLDALRTLTNEGGKFYGMSDKMSNDYIGRLDQIKGRIKEIGEEVGHQALGDVTEYLGTIIHSLEGKDLEEKIQQWGKAIDSLVMSIAKVANFIATHPELVEWVAKIGGGVIGINMLAMAGQNLFYTLATVGGSFKMLTGGMAGIATGAEKGGKAVSSLWGVLNKDINTSSVKKASTEVGNFGKKMWDTMNTDISMIGVRNVANETENIGKKAATAGSSVENLSNKLGKYGGLAGLLSVGELAVWVAAIAALSEAAVAIYHDIEQIQGKYWNQKDQLDMGSNSAKMIDAFQKSSEAMKAQGVDMDHLKQSTDQLFGNIEDKITSIKKLSTLSYLNYDQKIQLQQLQEFFNKFLPEESKIKLDAKSGNITNFNEFLSGFQTYVSKMPALPLIVNIDPKLKPVMHFNNSYNWNSELLKTFGGDEVTEKDLALVTGLDKFPKAAFNYLKESFSKENVGKAFNGVNLYSWLNQGQQLADQAKSTLGDIGNAGAESAKRIDEEFKATFDNITAEAQKAKIEMDMSPQMVATFDASQVKNGVAQVQGMIKGFSNQPVKLFDDSKLLETLTKTPESAVNVWTELGTLATQTVNKIYKGNQDGTIDFKAAADNQQQLEQLYLKVHQSRLNFLASSGDTAAFNQEKQNYETHLSSMKKSFSDYYATMISYAQSMLMQGNTSGFLSTMMTVQMLKQVSDELQSKQDFFKKQAEKFASEHTETPKKPEQIVSENYSVLEREYRAEMLSLDQFLKKSKALRDQYFAKGSLDYREYTAKIQIIADDAHQKALDKEKKALDESMKLSARYLKNSAYVGLSPGDSYIDAYNRIKARESKALKDGAITANEYEETMLRAGQDSYDARKKLSDNWLEQQKRIGTWSYQAQVDSYDRMSTFTKEFHDQGLLEDAQYHEALKAIETDALDARANALQKYMSQYQQATQETYSKATDAVNKHYDDLERRQKDQKTGKKLDELLKEEADFMGATTKQGKAHLKDIQGQIADAKDEQQQQAWEDARKNELGVLKENFDTFSNKVKDGMDLIGTVAIDTTKTVKQQIDELMKALGPVPEYLNGIGFKGDLSAVTKMTAPVKIEYNTVVHTTNTAQANAVVNGITDTNKIKQMNLGVKR